jgi:hypothetical protein
MRPKIELVQKRIANISITPSTLRNQGARKMVDIAQAFLTGLELNELGKINSENQFRNWLNNKTSKLMNRFPAGAKTNWGAARKAINIFLEEMFYNRFLVEEYGLQKLECFLEVPLDNIVINKLIKEGRDKALPKWGGIKRLTLTDSRQFQEFARNVAKEKGTARVYLDLEFWG